MTNPITQQASMAAADMQAKQADARDKARINNENKDSTAEARAPAEAPKRSNDDVLSLSATAQSAMKEPGFDSTKVDAIKAAIRDGNYPLNAKRIAENFVAIEQMIRE